MAFPISDQTATSTTSAPKIGKLATEFGGAKRCLA
jgi:hypothetical protein